MAENDESYKTLHEKVCAEGRESYLDHKTGYVVFTRIFHLKRGHCCESGCRHCPYGFSGSKTPAQRKS